MITLKESEKGRVCYIKANQKFILHIDGHDLPSSIKEQDGKWSDILSAEYCWYKIGKLERSELKKQLLKHLDHQIELNEKEVKKIKDVLKYRSPSLSQMRWILDLNKANGFFPQPFWDLTKSEVYLKPCDNKIIFDYKIGFI